MQYSFGFQREMPGNILFEASYVGRQARKLFTQADAAQVLDFRDPASGQGMLAAFNAIQAGGGSQPWFENQVNAATLANYGAPCTAFGYANCTDLVLDFVGFETSIGETSGAVFSLYGSGLLLPNVGMSSQFGTNIYISNQGSSSYNGLLLSARKRFSQGFQFDFNYTLSNSIDNQSSVVNTVAGGLVCDLTNLRVCRGPSDFDIRHLINVNGIWELPIGRGRLIGGGMPGWANAIIGGWELSGIFTARSGLAWHPTTGAFPRGFSFNSPAVVVGSGADLDQAINNASNNTIQFFANQANALAALDFPRHGEIGNRNSLRGPSFWNADIAILKNFGLPWSENHRLQIRAEMYNAFNHHVFDLPPAANRNIQSTAFGQVTGSASTPREFQFGIRYDF